ncbi:bifunctional adenosylcobinamide kinase/adenosylcobinamide-phosphate guanylyltransferase [Lysinibacillus macroides]|uniref:Adenosylcobinamide kinase n=1 Tax=Lysinibacillus macroides TaxID=33935 RepID=A0A0N0CUV5_9BACI|nr:bifunctional adenosylcobinamide kinase/adenosylcobinamide-phosphate guanylyltransferase [Lysinibacillus macroides]KOY80544.1 cobinamide kinase [Lysinibacillus macroides]QPR69676.1 bifunctional adenosylcobinamide kinase/adenosylcobinamide-phosphate guanylyltransferase [Lysinibacillus macroides]
MPLIFITGGVRSGKSHFAEQMAMHYYQAQSSTANRLIYLASGIALDEEMQQRILRHQADRQAQPIEWQTMEAPYAIADALAIYQADDIVLWDCVTTWLTNAFYEGFESGTPCLAQPGCVDHKLTRVKQAIEALLKRGVTLLVVSNELFDEPSYASYEVELYRQTLGQFHQWFVAIAREAYEIHYGIVKKWK